jgi:hypothetical protein
MPTKNIETREMVTVKASNKALTGIIQSYDDKWDKEFLLLSDWHYEFVSLQGRVKDVGANIAVVSNDLCCIYERKAEVLFEEGHSDQRQADYLRASTKKWAIKSIETQVVNAVTALAEDAFPAASSDNLLLQVHELQMDIQGICPHDHLQRNELLLQILSLWQEQEKRTNEAAMQTWNQQYAQIEALKGAEKLIRKNPTTHYEMANILEKITALVADLEAFMNR